MPLSISTFLKPAFGLMAATLLVAQSVPLGAQGPGMHRAEKHESKHEIDQLEEEWRDATLKSNTSLMGGLLADDYIGVTASGTLQTKDQALANLRDGTMHFTSLGLSDRKVRFYGTTAVVNSIASVEATTPDGKISGNFRYTRVYVRDSHGAWKVVSFEASRIREPGERK
jgi:ketosteroid isomerase-like protein